MFHCSMNFFIEGSLPLSMLDLLYDQKNGSLARRESHQGSQLYISINKITSISVIWSIILPSLSERQIKQSKSLVPFQPNPPSCPSNISIFTTKNPSKTFHAFEKILRIRKTNNNNPPTFNEK